MPNFAAHDGAGPDQGLRSRVAELEAENARLRADLARMEMEGGHVLAGAEELIAGLQRANAALDESRAALAGSEARYRAVLESATGHAIITMDQHGRVTGWSPGAVALLGWEEAEALGQNIAFIWTEEDRAAGVPEKARHQALTTGRVAEERWHLRRDGSRFWGSGQLTSLELNDTVGFVKIMRDETERWQAVEALRESEARLAAIFGAAATGLCEISTKGTFLRVNDELCRILGRSRRELLRMGVADVTHPDDLEQSFEVVRQVLESRSVGNLDKRYRRPDGTEVWANSSISALLDREGQVRSLLVVTADLTDRRAAEAAVRESENRLRSLIRASSEILYCMNADWTEMRRLEGGGFFPEADQPGAEWFDRYVHPADQAMVRAAIQEAIRTRGVYELEHRTRREDGSWGWVQSRAVPLLDEAGELREWFGAASDVTARREAEEALREQKERFRLLVLGMPQLVWRAASGGSWTWSSPQWQAYTGQSETESLALGWLKAVHPEDRGAAMRAWHEAPLQGRLNVEFRIRRAIDGAWQWHRTRSLPVRDEPPPGQFPGRIVEWVGTSTDIEDLMRLQQQQQVLVAELQHRTRNLLTVIRSILTRSLPRSPEREELDGRLAALGRVQDFLTRTPAWTVSLHDLVMAELVAVGEGKSRKSEIAGPPVQISGDKVQPLALALHELATNAAKYGAIAQPAAQLSVNWCFRTMQGKEHLLLEWRESGVAMPQRGAPQRQGFGTQLITRALPYQLRAKADLSFMPDGVCCRITLPASGFRKA
ncbi:PAS domain S-box protein [Pseudoroseomonas ludipueritiae]|uniref:histidine kinase n=1 Tax=Pseudoroseomonas ludipueritiae TaxID=198093 RepID=A0ABR7R6R3_9PROT|nr:PAS domain S-box protein [Pseudoroseomonas ludipueritiae]MBC9177396.1 PAS domain S-box protein [Pseudoroseomonas ludipueritiae]